MVTRPPNIDVAMTRKGQLAKLLHGMALVCRKLHSKQV